MLAMCVPLPAGTGTLLTPVMQLHVSQLPWLLPKLLLTPEALLLHLLSLQDQLEEEDVVLEVAEVVEEEEE